MVGLRVPLFPALVRRRSAWCDEAGAVASLVLELDAVEVTDVLVGLPWHHAGGGSHGAVSDRFSGAGARGAALAAPRTVTSGLGLSMVNRGGEEFAGASTSERTRIAARSTRGLTVKGSTAPGWD